MIRIHPAQRIGVVCALLFAMTMTQAEESKVDLGLRFNVLLGDGVPANDILGLGVIGRYQLKDGWFVGAALDAYEYDFERPSTVLGITQDPTVDVVDALADSTVISALLGRQFGNSDRGFDWFWSAGVGVGMPSVDNVAGPTDSGGTFDLTFDANTEIHLMLALGTTYDFSPSWSASFAARVEHHFMDILVEDRVTGATATVDSQTPLGAYISLNYSF